MDKRLGNPVPTYGQRKEEERARKMERGEPGQPQEKKKPAAKIPSSAGNHERRKGSIQKTKPIITSITTLNPPARLAKERKGTTLIVPSYNNKKGQEVTKTQGEPPRQNKDEPRQDQQWTEVVKRKGKTAVKKKGKEKDKEIPFKPPSQKAQPPQNKRRKEPKMAAVTVTCPPGQYESIMREARQKINLEDVGIKDGVKVKRAITGALMYEVPGERSQELADSLARRLKAALANKEGVKVQRPTKTAEIRIKGLDDSVTTSDIRNVVADEGGCEWEEVRVGEVKKTPGGMGIVWVRCPLTAANILAKKGQVKIGWARTRIDLLEARPLQCFKCLEGGHVRARCPNKVDRSDTCYRCGQTGHMAKSCDAPAHCAICSSRNLPANHRTGGKACAPVQKGKKGIPLNRLARPREEAIRAPVEIPKEQRVPKTRKGAIEESDAMETASEHEEEKMIHDGHD